MKRYDPLLQSIIDKKPEHIARDWYYSQQLNLNGCNDIWEYAEKKFNSAPKKVECPETQSKKIKRVQLLFAL